MRIVGAAVRCNGFIFAGLRHGIIMQDIWDNYFQEAKILQSHQGFITDTGEFVGRAEAAKIAYGAGQIQALKDGVFSEDLWPGVEEEW